MLLLLNKCFPMSWPRLAFHASPQVSVLFALGVHAFPSKPSPGAHEEELAYLLGFALASQCFYSWPRNCICLHFHTWAMILDAFLVTSGLACSLHSLDAKCSP